MNTAEKIKVIKPETLEEAAKAYYLANRHITIEHAFQDGAKWQQERSGESDESN